MPGPTWLYAFQLPISYTWVWYMALGSGHHLWNQGSHRGVNADPSRRSLLAYEEASFCGLFNNGSSDHTQSPKAFGAQPTMLFTSAHCLILNTPAHPTKAMAAGFHAGAFLELTLQLNPLVLVPSEHTGMGGVKVPNVNLEML